MRGVVAANLEDYPILPKGAVTLMRSHYERVPEEKHRSGNGAKVYYITDTNYMHGMPFTGGSRRQVGRFFPRPTALNQLMCIG